MSGYIALEAPCHCRRASKILLRFIVIYVIDVSCFCYKSYISIFLLLYLLFFFTHAEIYIRWHKHLQNGGRLSSWVFEIFYFGHMACVWAWLFLHTRFRINWTINCWNKTKGRFSIWRPSAILKLQNFDVFVTWPFFEPKFVMGLPKFIEIWWSVAEIYCKTL